MKTQLLSELREPPVIGRFYMVPVVKDYPWWGRDRDWPVLGPLHEDREFFSFSQPHYHIDLRFLNEHDYRFTAKNLAWQRRSGDIDSDAALSVSAAPLSNAYRAVPKGRPELQLRRCRRHVIAPTAILQLLPFAGADMELRYGSPAEPIRKADGRLLCPHRKVDLSQFTPDADGIVTCPLHGLRVRCAA